MKEGEDKHRRPLGRLGGSDGLAFRLVRGGAISLLAKFAEAALSVLLLVILARGLNADALGIYAFALALASLLSVPARMGLPPLVVRETARGLSSGDWSAVRGLWRWAHIVALTLSLSAALAMAFWATRGGAEDASLRQTLLWGAALIPFLTLVGIRTAALQGLRHVVASVLADQVFRPAVLVCFVGGVVLSSATDLSPPIAMALTVLSALLAFLLGGWLLLRARPESMALAPHRYFPRLWLLAAWPMALTQGFQQINRHIDLILLGILATKTDVGLYRIAAQGALMVSLGLAALNMVIAPFMAQLHAKGEHLKLQKLVTRTAQASLLFAILAWVAFALLGEWLLITFFGAEFTPAFLPLLILGLGQVLNAGFGAVGLLLNMTGHERDVTKVVGFSAGANILLNLALVPFFGAIGAAIATSLSLLLWNVWLWRVVRKRLKIQSAAI